MVGEDFLVVKLLNTHAPKSNNHKIWLRLAACLGVILDLVIFDDLVIIQILFASPRCRGFGLPACLVSQKNMFLELFTLFA